MMHDIQMRYKNIQVGKFTLRFGSLIPHPDIATTRFGFERVSGLLSGIISRVSIGARSYFMWAYVARPKAEEL